MTFVSVCAALAVAAGDYHLWDAEADHKVQAIEFDEAGEMGMAVDSFLSAALLKPTASGHWNNLGISLIDENFAGLGPG
jgi:hypothetical protein